MTIKRIIILFIFLLSFFNQNYGQETDSLWRIYHEAKNAEQKLNALDEIAWAYTDNDPDSAIILARLQINLAVKHKKRKYQAEAYRTIGVSYETQGDYEEAKRNLLKALAIHEELKDKDGISGTYMSFGNVYCDEGNFTKSMIYYRLALNVCKEINDTSGIGTAYLNIGLLYMDQSNNPKALEYELLALKIMQKTGNKRDIGMCYTNIGLIYYDMKDYEKAMEYYEQDLAICRENNDEQGIGSCYNNIGLIYLDKKDYKKAQEYFLKDLSIAVKQNDQVGYITCYTNLGTLHQKQKKYDVALEYFAKAIRLAREMNSQIDIASLCNSISEIQFIKGNTALAKKYADTALAVSKKIPVLEDMRLAYENLAKIYDKTGNFREAYLAHVAFKNITDSIFNSENNKKLGELRTNFEVEKREVELKAEQEKQKAIYAAEKANTDQKIKNHELQRNAFILGGALLVLLAFLIWRNLRQSKKANQIILSQKKEVETQQVITQRQKHTIEAKQKEIVDSITYAKRLQQAILATHTEIKQHLPETFLYYQPKDIVAGDFYFFEQKDDLIFIAAADCTGHGVPGALVSIICANALSRSVKEFGLTDPGSIMDKSTEIVLETFRKSGQEIKDGMDISLLTIHKSTGEIKWAGANIPLWYADSEMKEIMPDKQPIGLYENKKTFKTHHIPVKKGNMIYLFTDGYADQFGGPSGKKFKYSQLKKLLQSISAEAVEMQAQILQETHENWKGGLEQVDDVCVIGIRI